MHHVIWTDGKGALGHFGVKTRAAQTLFGKVWEGSFEEAAAGHVKTVVADMERRRNRLAAGRNDAAGLVGISWNDMPGGFRYLVALPPELSGQGSKGYRLLFP